MLRHANEATTLSRQYQDRPFFNEVNEVNERKGKRNRSLRSSARGELFFSEVLLSLGPYREYGRKRLPLRRLTGIQTPVMPKVTG